MNELYYTQSTNLAAYLLMHGHEIVGTRRINGKTSIYFNKSDQLHDCVRAYNSETKLKEFIASFKKVKEATNYGR
jgi:hypothetical protein